MLLLLAAQTSTVAPVEAERVVIDLTVPAPCPDQDDTGFDDAILVCAERDAANPQRMTGARGPAAKALPRAEIQLPDGTTLTAETESADMGMARSQRVMVRWKLKF